MRWIASARRRRPARRRVPASCRTARHASAGPHACLAAHSAVARRSSRQACGRPSTASPMPCAGRAAPPSGWGTRPRIPCRWPAAPDGPRRCVNHSMSHAASHPANCPAHRCASHPRPDTGAQRAFQCERVTRRETRQDAVGEDATGHAADVELQPDRPGRIALDDVRRGTARHRGARRSGLAVVATEAVATEARESGVAATGTLAMEKLRRTPSSSSSCTCCPGSQA